MDEDVIECRQRWREGARMGKWTPWIYSALGNGQPEFRTILSYEEDEGTVISIAKFDEDELLYVERQYRFRPKPPTCETCGQELP